ncbi:hypothetical protein [Halegenticoccus soli]|uniref:hypothetical protein n=1 Tax=Halegenticoccus soli TaxID=1985678 RepID=UPI000C6CB1D3|nr:hypothetical protein [Halegenticoccus soli]
MLHNEALGLLIGAVALGAVHGVEPGHGWPVAASYALDRTNKWFYGLAASLVIGIGHLVSSVAMVAAFFYAKAYFDLAQVNEPIAILGGVRIGGPVSVVAGVLLIALGVREYTHGRAHSHSGDARDGHGGGHGHDHTDHDRGSGEDHGHHRGHGEGHAHGHDHRTHDGSRGGVPARVKAFVPFVGGHSHDHSHDRGGEEDHERHRDHDENADEAADRGLLGIAWFAFVLGFAHEEEFEIIALCAGSDHCLELMGAYAITVIVGIVGLTMLLIAGYEHFEETVEKYTPYLPAFSAAVLVLMGVGFIAGVF